MSGDVQPRKRKDKRRKKDELGVEEPRGTAAVFGEGDVLMHSHHEHGTGGHWCAKIIFFSLLAVLVTLIGLIILENRGLSELEANAVESRYSGVLEGWIEDSHDDDHHDEHTLELKHHNYEDIHEDNDVELEDEDEENHSEDDDETHSDEDEDDGEEANDEEVDDQSKEYNEDSEEEAEEDFDDQQLVNDDNEEQKTENDSDDNDDDENDNDNNDNDNNDENDDDDIDDDSDDHDNDDDNRDDNIEDDDNGDEDDEDDENEVHDENIDRYDVDEGGDEDSFNELESNVGENFKDDSYNSQENIEISHEDSDDDHVNQDESNPNIENDFDESNDYENFISNEVENDKEVQTNEDSEQDEKEVDDQDEEIEKIEREVSDEEEQAASYEVVDTEKDKDGEDTAEEDDEFESPLEVDDVIVPPVVEHITVPSGKPFVELDEEPSSEKPVDSLAEEEEYERRQEELRQQKEESSSQMWLKLVVGGALLVATHAVIRRSTATRDSSDVEDNTTREDTPPIVDRRMTLIPKEAAPLIPPETFEPVHEEAIKKIAPQTKTVYTTPIRKQESDEKEESENSFEAEVVPEKAANDRDKELYSDEEEIDEEVYDEEVVEEVKESPVVEDNVEASKDEESEPEEVPDDVEIIDEEQIEEEIEEEEEEISDVDDAELLTRLEAKYGRLPEPHRPGQKPKDGGNNAEDAWPGDPADQYWRQQLDQAEEEIRQGAWSAANGRLAAADLANSGRARWLAARSLDAQAEAKRDNALLTRAITAYLHLLKMYDGLSDAKLKMIASRALDRIQFRGNYLSAEPVYRLLIHRFPDEVSYRNNLTVSFLMANRADLASDTLKETLKLWPEDRVALAHYGFVLKTTYNKVEESVTFFNKALEGDKGPACEPRFYYHLGDALLLLNRFEEANEVHKRGAKYGHFLSPSQRSLYNVERLKGRPWWRIEETPYVKLARALEQSWKEILKEGEAAKALYEMEKEGLKKKGEWSQLDIFVRGREIPGRCKRAPVTCSIVKAEVAAASCRRGQIKFSSMEPGTHVRPHVGPTNCRLRMHLALSNTKDTYIRVDQETRQWQTGKTLLFDDSFEHEVWHNGTGTRLVLIVDVWHPELSAAERRQLPAI